MPDSRYFDPVIVRLSTMAANLVDWCNDLYSYRRESSSQESIVVHNLVAVVASERRCSRQAALGAVRRTHDEELAAYSSLLPSAYRHADTPLRRYLDGLGMWVTGNEAWSVDTARYKTGERFTICEG